MRLADLYWLVICSAAIRGLLAQSGWPSPVGLAAARHPDSHGRLASTSQVADICSDPRCSCTSANVSCHCSPQDQEATLSIHPASVPREATHLTINGCRDVIFHEGSIKQLYNLNDVNVVDVGQVLFESGAFNQAQVARNAVVRVGRCRQLLLKSGSISGHAQHPASFISSQCHSVNVSESAFSRVQELIFSGIHQLDLASNAFRFATGATNIRTQETGVNITLENIEMKVMKNFTFPSPLNRLRMENVTVERIESHVISALRIAELSINGSRIGFVATSAFSHLTLLDSFEVRHTRINEIDSKAFASATSSLTVEQCHVTKMAANAISMPVAGVILRNNRIDVLSKASLDLREWNNLLIENNTFVVVERQAFYNIGDPKLAGPGGAEVRFVIRHNAIGQADSGAFVFSAQAHRLQLEDNYFRKPCDCTLDNWTSDLTRVNWDRGPEQPMPTLWLGSTFFNSSSCWMDTAASECTSTPEGYLAMNDFTSQFCHQPDLIKCVTARRSSVRPGDNQSPLVNDADRNIFKPIGLDSDQDLILMIFSAVMAVGVLLAIFLALVYARRRSKPRQEAVIKNGDREERVTCSPLIQSSVAEKSLGSGVVSSGSISRLSVKDYRNYLEELGPIYSEPLEPPFDPSKIQSTSPLLQVPPEVPAIPPEWGTKGSKNGEEAVIIEGNKRTIDRGTQTFNSSEPPKTSLAQEFTQEILAAFNDKLEVSPTYSEVKDSITPDGTKSVVAAPTAQSGEVRKFYDQINVVNPPNTTGPENIYCKPWDSAKEATEPAESANSGQQSVFPPPFPKSLPPAEKGRKGTSTITSPTPFYIRGSLPKWPPPAKDTRAKTNNGPTSPTGPQKFQSLNSSIAPRSPVKDTKPAWRNSQTKSDSPKRATPTRVTQPSKVSQAKTIPEKEITQPDESNSKTTEQNEQNDDYAQVVPSPFSFSFKRPLFNRSPDPSRSPPPKPARMASPTTVCDYADPRDMTENLYSELMSTNPL